MCGIPVDPCPQRLLPPAISRGPGWTPAGARSCAAAPISEPRCASTKLREAGHIDATLKRRCHAGEFRLCASIGTQSLGYPRARQHIDGDWNKWLEFGSQRVRRRDAVPVRYGTSRTPDAPNQSHGVHNLHPMLTGGASEARLPMQARHDFRRPLAAGRNDIRR